MLEKLRQMEINYNMLSEKLTDPDIISDQQQYVELMREYKHMTPIVEQYHIYRDADRNLTEAKELLESG